MKKQKTSGHDSDKALAKAGTVNPLKQEKLHTDEPLSEKDEVKQAEERQRKQINWSGDDVLGLSPTKSWKEIVLLF